MDMKDLDLLKFYTRMLNIKTLGELQAILADYLVASNSDILHVLQKLYNS